MNLKMTIKNKRNNIIVLSIFMILVCVFVFCKSYFFYKEDSSYEILNTQVEKFESNDSVTLAVLINGETKRTIPGKYEGYEVTSVTCDNNASGSWDSEAWNITISNLKSNNTLCTISFKRYAEEILNGADPKLAENLIPVIIADDGVVTKADTQSEWYNYEDKVWANAVILEDETVTYENGDTIPESNIESYFVWIPRYKYKLWNLGNYNSLTEIDTNQVHTIDIVFGTDESNDSVSGECTTPMLSGESGSCDVGEYMTHPAFISFDVNGIWVGKFESGYKGATSSGGAEKNTNDPEKLQIKPNVYSWRRIQVSTAHLTSYNYKRELDSHMIKNTEWGAVSYLQHSAYGSQQSVRINNNSSYLTGYAAVNEPTTGFAGTSILCSETPEACNEYGTDTNITQPYNTETGYLASTTGNISGIYDMAGGAWEYMMGISADQSRNPMSGRHNLSNSGFIGTYGCPTCDSTTSGVDSSILENSDGVEWPEEKYYDLYNYQLTGTNFKNRILGDATGEMGPFQNMTYGTQTRQVGSWYDDEGGFASLKAPWFLRSARYMYGNGTGVFTFGRDYGGINSSYSFRTILAF